MIMKAKIFMITTFLFSVTVSSLVIHIFLVSNIIILLKRDQYKIHVLSW